MVRRKEILSRLFPRDLRTERSLREAGRYYHKIMKRDPGALRAPRGPLCRGEGRLPSPSRGTYASLDGQIATRNDGAKAFRGFPQGLSDV